MLNLVSIYFVEMGKQMFAEVYKWFGVQGLKTFQKQYWYLSTQVWCSSEILAAKKTQTIMTDKRVNLVNMSTEEYATITFFSILT